MRVELNSWETPNFVTFKVPPSTRQAGWQGHPKWALSDVDAEELAQLCDKFRADVFLKAGKMDPAKETKIEV